MKNKRKVDANDPPVVRAAVQLAGALEEIELLTSRTKNAELTTKAELARAADLLASAETAHREFLARLGELARAVEELRQRQNASAVTCSEQEERIEARRLEVEALEVRFERLAAAANAMGAALAEGAPAGTSDEVKERLRAVRPGLAASVDEARVLTVDARQAGLTDLERDAHAMRQRLSALLAKVDETALDG